MIVKFDKIVSCSSEHPTYPAANLLQSNSEKWKATWRCAKPGEMLAYVIFQLMEPSYITGVDIGNYQSCVVIVTGSTLSEPDNWRVIINHKFLTNDEASNNKFKDQVQLFTKRELNPETMNIKFDRIKVTCMQSANLKVLFGLSYIILRSDVTIDLGLDIFGKFKMKQPLTVKTPLEMMKEKILNKTEDKRINYKEELCEQIKKNTMENFTKCQEEKEPMKRPLLDKLEAGKADEVFEKKDKKQKPENIMTSPSLKDRIKTSKKSPKNTKNTPYGEELVAGTSSKDTVPSLNFSTNKNYIKNVQDSLPSKKRPLSITEKFTNINPIEKKARCSENCKNTEDALCKTCQRLPQPTITKDNILKTEKNISVKRKKPFQKLLDDVTFSLSGYVNPHRDEIRKKALNMGAKYIPDPNLTNKRCTHLICAFKNTPKFQQFKDHTKIVSHTFIEECSDKKTRYSKRKDDFTILS